MTNPRNGKCHVSLDTSSLCLESILYICVNQDVRDKTFYSFHSSDDSFKAVPSYSLECFSSEKSILTYVKLNASLSRSLSSSRSSVCVCHCDCVYVCVGANSYLTLVCFLFFFVIAFILRVRVRLCVFVCPCLQFIFFSRTPHSSPPKVPQNCVL
jgi:hypothetical protein